MKTHGTKTISFTSGKGGVGKTTLLSNISVCMAQKGAQVLVLDGDWGMANVDIHFNVKAKGTIYEVIQGTKKAADILVSLSPGVDLLPGGRGVYDLAHLSSFERRTAFEAILSLPQKYDFVFVDTSPGLHENVLFLNTHVDEIVMVLTAEASSLADSYALIKVLNQKNKVKKFSILCNQVNDELDGLKLYERFDQVVNRFLNIGLDYLGSIPMDNGFRKSQNLQRLILKQDFSTFSSLQKVAQEILSTKKQSQIKGIEDFWEGLVGAA
ncbi:MAG: AAA family ATPase [Pseudobdellovibrionaceae bacterium]